MELGRKDDAADLESAGVKNNTAKAVKLIPSWSSRLFSIKYLVLMGMCMYLIYIIQVLGPFHYNHHLYSSVPLPPNSARRRSIMLLSHHLYYAADNYHGDNEERDLREQWHRALRLAGVQDGQIESELLATYDGFDLGDLLRYILTLGNFHEEAFVRPRIYAEKMHVSFQRFEELASGIQATQQSTFSNKGSNSLFNMIDVDPQRPPLVVFESFPTSIVSLTFSNVYQFFDDLIAFARKIRQVYPTSLVVWIVPSSVAKMGQDMEELKKLYHHLVLNHLIVRFGVISVPFMTDAAVVKALSTQLSMIYHHADVYYKLYTSELHSKHIAEFGRGGNDAIARLAAINAYLRPLYESEGSITMYDVIHGKTNRIDNSTKLTLHSLCQRFLNTRKYSSPCLPEPPKRYPLLITGLGGTGTHFLANQLQELGFRINHEGIGSHGSVSWFYAINDVVSNVTYPYGALSDSKILSPRFDYVIHVIRDPLHQISSFTAHTNKTYNFLYNVVTHYSNNIFDKRLMSTFTEAHQLQHKCVRGESCHLEFAALSWMAWNRMIRRYSDKFFHIDDSDQILNHACEVLWHDYQLIRGKKASCVQERKMFLETTLLKRIWYYVTKRNFPTYKVHRHHEHYNASNLIALGSLVYSELSKDAKLFGYSITDGPV